MSIFYHVVKWKDFLNFFLILKQFFQYLIKGKKFKDKKSKYEEIYSYWWEFYLRKFKIIFLNRKNQVAIFKECSKFKKKRKKQF